MGADLCSVTAIKNEKKAIVSCADGALHVYNWGEFGHPSDIFPGHDKGDLVCCKLNEKVVLTGDFKGNIRPVNIQVKYLPILYRISNETFSKQILFSQIE